MKITCSKRDDILKRKSEYEKQYNERKSRYDSQHEEYDKAIHNVYQGVESAVLEAIGPSSIKLDVRCSTSLHGQLECAISSNDHNVFDKSKALSWVWSVHLNEDTGEVMKESSSWSGLQATTREQLDSLRETLRILEIINELDWQDILSVSLPKYSDIITEKNPAYDSNKPDFDRELLEVDIEESVGVNRLIRCVGGSKNYRGEVYVGIVKESPTMYTIFDIPASALTPNSDGTYGWNNYSSIPELVSHHQYTYRVTKDKFLDQMISIPTDIIEY